MHIIIIIIIIITLCLPEDEAALPREETSLHGLRDDSRFIPFSPSLLYLSPFTGDIAYKWLTTLILRFNSHFPGEPGLAGVY